MADRQQDLQFNKNRDNASKHYMVYPGACRKIVVPINQQSSSRTSPDLSNNNIDHRDDNISNYSDGIGSSQLDVVKNSEQKFTYLANKVVIDKRNVDRNKLIGNNESKQLTIAKSSTLNQFDNPNLYNDNRSFDLDWIDSRKVQSNSVGGERKRSLASENLYYITNNLIARNHNLPSYSSQRSKLSHNPNNISTKTRPQNNKTLYQYNPSRMALNTAIGGNTNDDNTILFDISSDEATAFYDDDPNLEGQLADGQLSDYRSKKESRRDDLNQLDEPIIDTLLRDLRGIYQKMKIIGLPNSPQNIYKIVLRGWDLWGPLLLCTFLAFNLHNDTRIRSDKSIGPHFADVFVLIWFGSGLLSLNYRLLSLSSINDQSIMIVTSDTSNTDTSGDKTTINSKITDDKTSPSQSSQTVADSGIDRAMASLHNQDGSIQLSISPPSILQLMCVFGYCLVAPSLGLIILKFISISNLMIVRIILGLMTGFIWPTWISIKILKQYQHPDKQALAIYPIGLFYFILSCMIILNQ